MAKFELFRDLNVVSYPVHDWAGAKAFYGRTLGLGEPSFCADEVGWCEWGGDNETHVAISRQDAPVSQPGGAILVFGVNDATAAVAELRARGVRCEDPVPIPGMVTYATFYDPEGNRLQLAGPPPAA